MTKDKMPDDRRGASELKHPVCADCAHYHVTWDPTAPHGCSAFGFKTSRRPSLVVYESSGVVCELFARPAHTRRQAPA